MKNSLTELTHLETEILTKVNLAKQQLALLKSISKAKLISPKTFGLAFLIGFLLSYRHQSSTQKPSIGKQLLKLISKLSLARVAYPTLKLNL